MNELHAILDARRALARASQEAVLATVVHVSGSAYRRPGARMLILPDGNRVGSISGGCLEGEIARKARWFTEADTPVVRAYDTTSDDDGTWEFGLGCNGVVHIMLERTGMSGTAEMLDFVMAHREAGEPAAVATVIRAEAASGVRVGDRLLVDENWLSGGALVGSGIEEAVRARAVEALDTGKSCLVHLDGADVFVEWIGPPLSLVVFGAGDDAMPLVAMAKHLGWSVAVADGRPAYARPDRFPGADRVVVMAGGNLLAGVDISPATAVVLMTHNYVLDARLLPPVLAHQPRYLGLLGPRSRTEKLFAGLGLEVPATVHAPVGLDIGGDTPAATALSIAAEIQAATFRRAGCMLRLRSDSIHPPVVEIGEPAIRHAEDSSRPAYCETLMGTNV